MTVIRPNSISGVTSITALANEINVFKHDGVLAGLQLNGVNHHTSSGVSTFHTLNVLGNVSVGGTLTYQDVTNVDSLGIGTFRTGINVSGGQLDVGSNIKLGNAGVITATSFSGDGSNLTGISVDSTKIETGNTKVETIDTGSDGHVKITTEGSERLRINSSGQLLVGATGNSTGGISEFSKSVGGGGAGCHITVENTSNNSVNNTAGIHLKTSTGTAKFFKYQANQTFIQSASGGASELNLQASGAHPMRFYTNGNERVRIDSSGFVGIENTSPNLSLAGARNLVIGSGSGDRGLTIMSGTSGVGHIEFSDGTGSSAEKAAGGIRYYHNSNYMRFNTNGGTERLRIASNGQVSISSDGTTDGLLTIKGDTDQVGTPSIRLLDGSDTREVSITNTSGDFVASVHGNDNAIHGHIKLFESGIIDFNNGGASGSNVNRLRIATDGNIGIGNRTSSPDQLLHVHTSSGDAVIHVEAGADPKIRLRAHSGESIVQFADASSSNVGEINYVHSGDYLKFRVNASDRMLIDSGGHLQLQHGLTALSGGGVIVCAAKSSSGTANQSNYKVDFVVPMGDLGTKKEYEDIRAQFSSGQTGIDWTHARGGSGILIATVQNDYYWGFRTKIYHITTYGNNTNNVTQLNLLHNYSAAGHGGNNAAVDLAVQSHDGKTPTLRATFSGDYWNSNVLTVTYIGSAVASTGNIRQTTTFDSKLTGQDPTWK